MRLWGGRRLVLRLGGRLRLWRQGKNIRVLGWMLSKVLKTGTRLEEVMGGKAGLGCILRLQSDAQEMGSGIWRSD